MINVSERWDQKCRPTVKRERREARTGPPNPALLSHKLPERQKEELSANSETGKEGRLSGPPNLALIS